MTRATREHRRRKDGVHSGLTTHTQACHAQHLIVLRVNAVNIDAYYMYYACLYGTYTCTYIKYCYNIISHNSNVISAKTWA